MKAEEARLRLKPDASCVGTSLWPATQKERERARERDTFPQTVSAGHVFDRTSSGTYSFIVLFLHMQPAAAGGVFPFNL